LKTLTPIDQIAVPGACSDDIYTARKYGRDYSFPGLKRLLGAADFDKAGDRNAALAAQDEAEREVARSLLSSLTLQHIYEHPLTDEAGRVDSVMRANYEIDHDRFQSLGTLTMGELKDHMLGCSGDELKKIGRAITGVMASALAKLLDTHELIFLARKINCVTKARTLLGLPGTLSSRLQPNHPVDDLRGVAFLIYTGLSLGAGDALIGLNPAIDTVENVSALLAHLDKLRKGAGVPTQICVLAHVKTQLACLAAGAPVEVLFQSLAGTESTNLTEFDITVQLLDEAYQRMAERGALAGIADQFMYFETGQGSEFTYGKHNGIDMTTTEALCYGLARRYDPFMVNNVTGFIGPETHRDNFEMIISNLQDHFMGKLMGLPMGMAPCYTLHSKITLEGQQMATELLAAAGANYYMDVCLNTDRMLAYFDTSAHDDQTLREIYARNPAPEYLEWAIAKGIMAKAPDGRIVRGDNWGKPRIFCESDMEFQELLRATPAIYGLEHAGPRPANRPTRELKLNQAIARQAITSELRIEDLLAVAPFRILASEAADKDSHLNSPGLGARLSSQSVHMLSPENHDVQIVVSDGLSAEAVHHNVADLLPVLADGLQAKGLRMGQPIIIRYGRVKVAEHLAECLKAKLIVLLIGERPGGDALASRSLSAYLVYHLIDAEVQSKAAAFSNNSSVRFEYTVISNIYSGGLPPLEAGSVVAEKAWQILSHHAAGNRLEAILKP
jgi:ethanolamine ammonia-lyase large subunit